MQLDQLHLHLLAQAGIEVAERLVEQKHLRVRDDRPGKRHTLLLATRELPRHALAEMIELNQVQRLLDRAVLALPVALAHHAQREPHVLADAQMRQERIGLEHHGDIAPLRRQIGDGPAADFHRAGRHLFQPRDDPQKRGLAAAARAQQAREAPLLEGGGDAMEHLRAPEGLMNVVDADFRHVQFPIRRLIPNRRSITAISSTVTRIISVETAATDGSGLNSSSL